MKKVKTVFALILILACILPAANAGADGYGSTQSLYCSFCGKQIPLESRFCMWCGKAVLYAAPGSGEQKASISWGPWSNWSTTPVYATENRQIETRTVITGYNMVHYGTQMASSPHYRMFRNFSVRMDMDTYGARESYGEKHFTRTVSAALLKNAVQYEPGTFISGDYSGYQKGTSTAYYFGDDKYVWFIESVQQVTEYRYRYSY